MPVLPASWRSRLAVPLRERRTRVAIGAAAAVAAAVLVAGYLTRPPAAPVAEVRRESVARVLAVTGQVAPRASVQVLPGVSGDVVYLGADEGETVAAGALLARVDAREALAQAGQAEAALAAQEAELRQARRDLARYQSLAGSGAVAAREVEDVRLRAERAGDEAARLRQALAEARVRVAEHELRAPFAGVVVKRAVDLGQTVSPETLIFEVAAADDPHVETSVDERYVDQLAPGMAGTVSESGSARVWEAAVSFIAPEIDVETGAARVRLRFLEPAPPRLGRSVDVNLVVDLHDDALTVPRDAVAGLEARPWVLRVQGGRVEVREVEVIDWPSPRLVVLRGLSEGDLVLLETRRVAPGTRIRPVRRSGAL